MLYLGAAARSFLGKQQPPSLACNRQNFFRSRKKVSPQQIGARLKSRGTTQFAAYAAYFDRCIGRTPS